MKGAVKKNISPPTGHRDERLLVAASPCSVETKCWSGLRGFRRFITAWCCLQKLKSMTAA